MDNESRTLNKTGEWGEIYVNRYVRKKGFDVIAANYNCRFGEADIICLDKKTLVFVEVKARTNLNYGHPFEAISQSKIEKIRMAISAYLKITDIKHKDYRFDGIAIIGLKNPIIEHLKNLG